MTHLCGAFGDASTRSSSPTILAEIGAMFL